MGPVGGFGVRGLDLQCRDRGLQLVLARTPQAHRTLQLREAFADAVLIPERSVLRVERDVSAPRIHASGAARVVQMHQRQQSPHLGVVGHQPAQQFAKADRLVA
jgi:hypothetical protein